MSKTHGLKPAEIDVILVELAQHAMVLTPASARPAPELGDQHLWDLLAVHQDSVLVTGDKLLQQDEKPGSRIVSLAAFVGCGLA